MHKHHFIVVDSLVLIVYKSSNLQISPVLMGEFDVKGFFDRFEYFIEVDELPNVLVNVGALVLP